MPLLILTCTAFVIGFASCAQAPQAGPNHNTLPTETAVAAVSRPDASQSKRKTPESVGAVQLTRLELFPKAYRKPARLVAEQLIKKNEDPNEFYAEVTRLSAAKVLIFHLWHQDAFTEEHKNELGNPGGKCRDVYYDLRRGRVGRSELWQ